MNYFLTPTQYKIPEYLVKKLEKTFKETIIY